MSVQPVDSWEAAEQYERYMGRWSRLAGAAFLDWLACPPDGRWLEVGCGTGALTATILARARPAALVAADLSTRFLGRARRAVPEALFAGSAAGRLPVRTDDFDVAVSGLALNFFPDQEAALRELRRAVRPGGVVAAYVWDYAGGMEMLRHFWDAVVALDPAAGALDEGLRFPQQDGDLAALFRAAGLRDVATATLDVPAVYRDFDDYWLPFLDGPGPAPGYVKTLPPPQRAALTERLRATLPTRPDGSIGLRARAWAVRGAS